MRRQAAVCAVLLLRRICEPMRAADHGVRTRTYSVPVPRTSRPEFLALLIRTHRELSRIFLVVT